MRLVKKANFFSVKEDEVFLQLAPISFDASTFEIWGPLLNGGRLVVFPAHIPSLAELAETIRKHAEATKQFIDYLRGEAAQKILAAAGFTSPAGSAAESTTQPAKR